MMHHARAHHSLYDEGSCIDADHAMHAVVVHHTMNVIHDALHHTGYCERCSGSAGNYDILATENTKFHQITKHVSQNIKYNIFLSPARILKHVMQFVLGHYLVSYLTHLDPNSPSLDSSLLEFKTGPPPFPDPSSQNLCGLRNSILPPPCSR